MPTINGATQVTGATRVTAATRIVGATTTAFTPNLHYIVPAANTRYALAALAGASYTHGTNPDAASTDPAISTSQVANNERIVNSTSTHGSQTTALVPLVPIGGDGGGTALESPMEGWANEFARQWSPSYTAGMIVHQRAIGGSALTSFINGTGSYANSMATIDDAVTEASPDSVVYVALLEGTSIFIDETGGIARADNTPDVAWATTETRLRTLLADWRSELTTRTGQTYQPPMITWQIGWWQISSATAIAANYALQQLDLCITDTDFIMSEPTYQYAFSSDDVHKVAAAYLRMGMMLGHATAVETQQGRRWLPLHCSSSSWSGSTVTLNYTLPYGSTALELNTTTYAWRVTPASATTHGFRYIPNVGASRSITNVAISGSSVVLTLDGAAESGAIIGYADFGSDPTNAPPNGNLTTTVFRTSDSVDLRNFAAVQQITLA